MKESVDFTIYDNKGYNPGNKLKIIIWYFINHLIFNTFIPFSSILKCLILRFFGAKVGDGVLIKPRVSIKYPWFLEIGNDTWIGEGVWIDNLAYVRIGKNVCLSQGAYILTGSHNYKKESFDLILNEIMIEDGVWVGARAVVCPGVTCASHSVLAVGSVATINMEEYYIYQGNPAVKKRERIFK